VVSPSFEILLLHRVQTSSSFPSAHVFPGGNVDKQDGHIPEGGVERHQDNQAYRVGALRELFEESGILLARQDGERNDLISIPQTAREEGRKLVHSDRTSLQAWLSRQNPDAVLDTDGLIPFSHWITPSNIPRRFTTQMYLYILPSKDPDSTPEAAEPPTTSHKKDTNPNILTTNPTADFTPTSDGSLENTAATFSRASTWLTLAQSGTIILFPPQFLLLHLIARFLDHPSYPPQQRIQQLLSFIHQQPNPDDGTPPWSHKYISPYALTLAHPREDGKVVLALDKPGPEVEGFGLKGDGERVVLVKWRKEGPRELEVRMKREVLEEGRREVGREGGVQL
jgi:8-oxo-dGTP pyrophosphatase MutT (NUDIX family)